MGGIPTFLPLFSCHRTPHFPSSFSLTFLLCVCVDCLQASAIKAFREQALGCQQELFHFEVRLTMDFGKLNCAVLLENAAALNAQCETMLAGALPLSSNQRSVLYLRLAPLRTRHFVRPVG